MKQTEDKIRDILANNLEVFRLNLELISTEYFIPQKNTTRSFIDILARDNDNNYIIIEVKRSNQSAREAIHEIYKYIEAVIDHFRISPEEVKAIIVSTEWKELYVPFSAFVNESKNTIIGFDLSIDDKLTIKNLVIVKPCNTKNGRLFSPIHDCSLYYNETNLSKGIESHLNIYKEKNIDDFVLVILEGVAFDEEKYKSDLEEMLANILGESKSEFKGKFDDMPRLPFMIYTAFQRLGKEEYLDIIRRDDDEYKEITEYLLSFDDEDDILSALENSLLGNLKPWFYSDYKEIGYPAKFAHKILEEEEWEIKKIIRSESLTSNTLLTDEKIISEIKGETGTSNVKLYDSCSFKHVAKLNGIKERAFNCLKYNLVWQNDIDIFFKKLPLENEGNINISIFSPQNILLTIIYMVTNEQPMVWLPNYELEVITENENNVYLGTFHWTGKIPSFDVIVEKYYNSQPANILMPLIWSGHEKNNNEIMEDLGLTYESYLVKNPQSDTEKIFHYTRYKFVEKISLENGLIDLINNSRDFVNKLALVYKTYHHKATIEKID